MKNRVASGSKGGKSEISKGVEEQGATDSVALGDVIYIRLRSGSWWPAQVVDENKVPESIKPGKRLRGEVLLRLYGSYQHVYANPIRCCYEFEKILTSNNGSLRKILEHSLEQDLPSTKSHRSKGSSSKTKAFLKESESECFDPYKMQDKLRHRRRSREEGTGNEMPDRTRPRVDTRSAPQPSSCHADNQDTTRSTLGLPPSSVQTHVNSTCPVLTLVGDGFLPSHDAAVAITELFRGHYIEAWPSWTKIPKDMRKAWFDQFMGKFSILPSNEGLARKNFEKRGAVLLKNHLEKVRKKGQCPHWLKKEVWEGLCRHWQSDPFKKVSSIAKANRVPESGGSVGPTHVGGSISASQHRLNMEKELGIAPSPIDVFRKTHQRKDLSWANGKSKELMERFTKEMNQRTQSAAANGNPIPVELDVWRDVAGIKRGHLYGIGSESKTLDPRPRYRGSNSSTADCRRELEDICNERDHLSDQLADAQDQLEVAQDRLEVTQDDLAKMKERLEEMNQMMQQVMKFLKFSPHSFSTGFSTKQERRPGDDAAT